AGMSVWAVVLICLSDLPFVPSVARETGGVEACADPSTPALRACAQGERVAFPHWTWPAPAARFRRLPALGGDTMSDSGLKATGPAVPQLTFRAVVLAIVLAVILSAANAYLGLFAGLTIATAIPAAVVSMGVLRLLGGGSILENNIVQTGASAGSSIAAGVIFTIPALIILGYWQDFKYSWVLAIAGLGGLLGVLFSVPLRRSMIVEEPLPFPEGKAAAEVLKAGENPGPGLKILAFSAAIGAVLKAAAASGMKLIPDTAAGAGFFGKYLGYMGTNLSPALLGVGYIVGLNIGIVVVSGSILSWHIAIPLYHMLFLDSDPVLASSIAGAGAEDIAGAIWSAKIRYLGVGAMLIGGVWTLFSLRKSLLSGVKSGIAAARKGSGEQVAETERDLPMKWMLVALVAFVVP